MPTYRNHNTGDVVERDDRDPRLEALDNWERIGDDGLYPSDTEDLIEQLAELTPQQRNALRDALAETADEDSASGDAYDPGAHTVDEVNTYLADAESDERERVLQSESEGKGRAGILSGPHADLSGNA